MARLSDIYKAIGDYLSEHCDKEVTSIATWSANAPLKYTLELHDVYSGPLGGNPYTGKDKIDIPK